MNATNDNTAYPSTPVLVIGHGECTQIFQKALANSPGLGNSKNAFDPDQDTYWKFRQTLRQPNLHPDQVRFEIWESHLKQLLCAQEQFSLIAVNPETLRQLDADTEKADEPPALIRWLSATQFPVIHLVRRNPLDCLIEQLVDESSRLNGKSHSSIDLNISAAIDRVAEIRNEMKQIRQWLTGLNRIEFYFESLFDSGGRMTVRAAKQLARVLEVEPVHFKYCRISNSNSPQPAFASHLRRTLRPALTRAGYENLFDLPKAA